MLTLQGIRNISDWKTRCRSFWNAVVIAIQTRWYRKQDGAVGLAMCLVKIIVQTFFLCFMIVAMHRFGIYLAVWAWERRIDEGVDGLRKIHDIFSYLRQKENLLKRQLVDRGALAEILPEDILLIHVLQDTKALCVDLENELATLLRLFSFDAERRLDQSVSSAQTLIEYATNLEVSVMVILAKISGGNISLTRRVIEPLQGIFQRIDFLVDVLEDAPSGIINIPQEAVEKHGIDTTQLFYCQTWAHLLVISGFRGWYQEAIQETYQEWQSTRSTI